MQTALDLTKFTAPANEQTPSKVLVVDDDDLQLSLMADWLGSAGYEVATASDGAAALHLIEAEWFPVVVADWQMPVMNGIQLIESLRDRGVDNSYFIMLSARNERLDFERGYAAGVDDYLTKKAPDPELLSRIQTGLRTIDLRLKLRATRDSLHATQEIAERDSRLQLIERLQTEMARVRRYRRPCSLMMLNVDVPVALLAPHIQDEILSTVRSAVRTDIDFASYYGEPLHNGLPALAIVLPETADASALRLRLKAELSQTLQRLIVGDPTLQFGVDAVTLDLTEANLHVAAEDVLATAFAKLGHL